MIAEELKRTLLAEQRHAYVDLDADSAYRPTDRKLCDHGHPLGNAGIECRDCSGLQYRRHTEDWEELGNDDYWGAVRFCRRCGLSSGTHYDGLL